MTLREALKVGSQQKKWIYICICSYSFFFGIVITIAAVSNFSLLSITNLSMSQSFSGRAWHVNIYSNPTPPNYGPKLPAKI